MSKQAILSLLVAGLITGSYLEFQVNQQDDVVDVIEAELPFEAVEPSAPLLEELIPPPPPLGLDISEALTFTPYSVAPSITNPMEVLVAEPAPELGALPWSGGQPHARPRRVAWDDWAPPLSENPNTWTVSYVWASDDVYL